MKPSTEILKRARERDLLKNRIRHKSPHLKEFQHRKRRFKPQNPRFRNPPRTSSTPPPQQPEQPGLPDNLIPDSFPKFDIKKSRVSSGEATQVQSPLGQEQDSFETTNMGRNRVVLLQEPEAEEAPVSFETELPPLYLASTTSRSLGEDEGGFVLRSSEESHTLAPSLELQSGAGELDSSQHELEPSLNDLEVQGQAYSLPTEDSNSVIKLGVSIEEVESAARGVAGIGSGPAAAAAAAAGVTEVKAAADTGEGAALYRFEYKLLGPGDAGDSAGQGSLLSLHTQSPDGLFHPEQQPTMEQLLDGDEVLNQFKHQFGSREIVEEVEDNELPSARQDSIEIFYIEDEMEDKMEAKVKDKMEAKVEAKAEAKVTPSPPPRPRHPPPHLFPVAVPADYPADMSPITSASSVVDTVDKRYRLSIIY